MSSARAVLAGTALRAPFPWFGGKSRVADVVWSRFGDVPNYVEPFAGSLAVLLARPHPPRTETVNDADCYLANFWRAVQADPEAVAHHADWPVNEADLHARHLWLVNTAAERVERLKTDPDAYDAKIAGWWVWGVSQWIGHGWCRHPSWRPRPALNTAGVGVHKKRPHLMTAGKGVHRQMPNLYSSNGVHRVGYDADVRGWFEALRDRLRAVRVCCGDWSRVLGPSVTHNLNGRETVTAVFLDPPYGLDERDDRLYAIRSDVAADARRWAVENGGNPLLRIALCGYEGEHAMPDDWATVAWKAGGGYGSQGANRARDNAARERIWFSPHCLRPERRQRGLFDEEVAGE